MSDTEMQNDLINTKLNLDEKVKNEHKKIPLIAKKKSVFKEHAPKNITLSIIKNDKEIQELIKPKFKIISCITLKNTQKYPLQNKDANHLKQLKRDANGNIYMEQTLKPLLKDVSHKEFVTLLPSNNNRNNQIQYENLGFPENSRSLAPAENDNILNATKYITEKNTLTDGNINMHISGTEIEENKSSSLLDNISNEDSNLSEKENTWEFIENTNILRNTKYILVKNVGNASVNIDKSINDNVTEKQVNLFEQASELENFPNKDLDAETNSLISNEMKSKPRQYKRKSKTSNTKPNNTPRDKISTKRGKSSATKTLYQNKRKTPQNANNISNQEKQDFGNISPVCEANNNNVNVPPSSYTMTETKSLAAATFPKINNSVSTSFPRSSQKLELINSEGKGFLLGPFNNVRIQRNSVETNVTTLPIDVKNIYSVVPLNNIKILNEGNSTETRMTPSESSSTKDIGLIRGTVSNTGAELFTNNIQQKKRVVIRKIIKNNKDAKKAGSVTKNKLPVTIRKSSKRNTLITKNFKQKQDSMLPKNAETSSEDASVIENTAPLKSSLMNDKVYMEIMNKFPLILPKEVSVNNSAKQSDILEKAVDSINKEEFMPDIQTHYYNSATVAQTIYTQTFYRERALMFYLKNDPMLPQYSTKKS